MKKNWITIILVVIALGGAGLLAYPTFSDWWNSLHQSRVVASYTDTVSKMDTRENDAILESAEKYNEMVRKRGIRWTMTEEERAEYEKELDITGTGIMGYLEIPSLNVLLAIYHGTNESVLQIATGHLEGSSLPVGGEGTHVMISGHTGLPSAKLLTGIRSLKPGDTWTITVLNRTLTYEMDQTLIVEPYDLSSLQIEPGADYCTLITCWPEGQNTHRLLVRGHRIDTEKESTVTVTADAMQIRPVYIAPFIAAPVLLLLILIMLISTGRRPRRKKEKGGPDREGKTQEKRGNAA